MTSRTPLHRLRPVRSLATILVIGVMTGMLSACLATPGSTSQVVKIDQTDVNGWHYDYYENRAYPCSISGYQTFAIGTKIGSSSTDARPLWVKMRGGGFGYFDSTGTPQPTAGNMSEIGLTDLLAFDTPGLMQLVKNAPEGFRVMLVSMCSHDLYGGNNTTDPYNPNVDAGGKPRLTNGLVSAKAAIQYTTAQYPTTKFFLHGTSAGGAGTFAVAWALQLQGLPPAGIVSDSGVINPGWEAASNAQGTCDGYPSDHTPADIAGISGRVDPDVANPANAPDKLISSGQLTVPVMHVWNHGDVNSCGETPMTCTLIDGSTTTMGAADCRHELVRAAIAAQGPTSRSANIAVCVAGAAGTGPCSEHVVTTRAHPVNTDPNSPSDYQGAILTWVEARLADPPPAS
jgi:hypothetical protein